MPQLCPNCSKTLSELNYLYFLSESVSYKYANVMKYLGLHSEIKNDFKTLFNLSSGYREWLISVNHRHISCMMVKALEIVGGNKYIFCI